MASSVWSPLLLVPWLGLHGAALGSLIGTAGISLPGNLRALARDEGVPLAVAIRPLRPWFNRFVPAFATALLALAWWPAQQLPGAIFAGSLVAILYGVLMLPILLQPPLGTLLAPRLLPRLALIPGVPKRPASHSMP